MRKPTRHTLDRRDRPVREGVLARVRERHRVYVRRRLQLLRLSPKAHPQLRIHLRNRRRNRLLLPSRTNGERETCRRGYWHCGKPGIQVAPAAGRLFGDWGGREFTPNRLAAPIRAS